MKHFKKLSVLLATALLATSFSSCVASITCISHIDADTNGKCDNCSQAVKISNIEAISVKTIPTKTYYGLGEKEIDVTGGVILVEYKDGTPAVEIPMSAEGVSVYANLTAMGNTSVSIEYEGKRTSYQIEVGAVKYYVSFDLGYDGAPAIEKQFVVVATSAERPADPVRDGYNFLGWYKDAEGTQAFDFAMDKITGETVIYANWQEIFDITYAANYEGGANTVQETVGGKIPTGVKPADRAEHIFIGWFLDAECTTPVDYNVTITSDLTVYAGWESIAKATYTVTFNENYGETPATSEETVVEERTATPPVNPTRSSVSTEGHQVSDFAFGGWYIDSACTEAYDFATPVTADITLYAKWTGTYIFEAEHVNLVDDEGNNLDGMGASGGAKGPDMVDSPSPEKVGINPSNGYYVTYLFAPGLALNFNIVSDRDVTDATLVFRITAETVPYILTPTEMDNDMDGEGDVMYSGYDISCNGTSINYAPIKVLDVTGHEATGGQRPFSDFTITVNLNLKKGDNVLTFLTANTHGMGGTMAATAPVIDCIKITTSASLSWTPNLTNQFGQ